MSELDAHQQVVVSVEASPVGLARLRQEPAKIGGRGLVKEKLSAVGPALWGNGRRLAPYELGTALAEAAPSPEGELTGAPVGRAVTAFHRVDGHPVASYSPSDGHGLG